MSNALTRSIKAVWTALFEFIKWFGAWISQPQILIVVVVLGGAAVWGQERIVELVGVIADAIAKIMPSF